MGPDGGSTGATTWVREGKRVDVVSADGGGVQVTGAARCAGLGGRYTGFAAPRRVREQAPAKLNLLLRVGRARADGMHPLVSVFARLELADTVEIELDPALAEDVVVCPGVAGENLVARALQALRDLLPTLPPLRATIDKRIPVAAGLGGGSADAAAALRAALALAGDAPGRSAAGASAETPSPLASSGQRAALVESEELARLALALGADVPSQLEPRHLLVWGVGERFEPLTLPPLAVVLVPHTHGLATARVYREFDRRYPQPPPLPDLDTVRALFATASPDRIAAAVANDLAPVAAALAPEIAVALDAVRRSGALAASVSGSGPTVFGLYRSRAEARTAAAALRAELPSGFEEPIVTAIADRSTPAPALSVQGGTAGCA